MHNHTFSGTFVLITFLIAIVGSSCTVQNMYSGATDTAWPRDIPTDAPVHLLAPGDKITVSVLNHEDLSIGSTFGIYNSNEVYGKWVMLDEAGYALLPGLHKVKLAGLTTAEGEDLIKEKLTAQIVDPVVVVKVLNRQVSILGEVRNPGSYILDREDHSLAEMISIAGGSLNYADLKSLLLVRNSVEYRLDMTSKRAEPDFQVYDGDLVLIPTRKGKMLDQKAPTLIPFASAATALVLAVSLVYSTSGR